MNFKPADNLFMGIEEFNRFKLSIFEQGYKFIAQNYTSKFGILRNKILDPNFNYFKTQIGGTSNNIKVLEGYGLDKGVSIIHQLSNAPEITIIDNDIWQWLKISFIKSSVENGLSSIGGSGALMTGVGTEFTKILRGQPNYPSKIKFVNSTRYNSLEYEVLEVIDDTNVLLNGVFDIVETNLQFVVVGTFTPGSYPSSDEEKPFEYDNCLIQLVNETVDNTAPGLSIDYEFFIARIMNSSTDGIIIQDKRSDYLYTTNDLALVDVLSDVDNKLIGVEDVRYNHPFTTLDKNTVEIAWSFRSANWVVNASTNVITLSSGLGGKFKTSAAFTNGDFNGWRAYAPDGTYSIVRTSVKTGGAINLTVDSFDINSFSPDGGITFYDDKYVVLAPDVEEIEIIFTPNPTDTVNQIQRFTFPINELIGRCDVLVYLDPFCLYVVSYRYKSFKKYSTERLMPSDTVNGYYNESSFDAEGNILLPIQTTKVPYTSSFDTGFIKLVLSLNAYSKFTNKVDKGDLRGVTHITSLTGVTNIDLRVGIDLDFLMFSGNITLSNDVNININTNNIVNRNEFRIQFNCESFNLNGHTLKINTKTISTLVLKKELKVGDFYQMLNIDNGLIIDAVSDGTDWFLNQNYDLGLPNQVIDFYNVDPAQLFDMSTFLGNVKGTYGICIANMHSEVNYGAPDLSGQFIVGYDPDQVDYDTPGNIGGSASHTLVEAELPVIDLNRTDKGLLEIDGTLTVSGTDSTPGEPNLEHLVNIPTFGGGLPHENRPQYFTLIKGYKLY